MLERRKGFRGRVYYGGRIAFNERKSTIDCIVRNFSPFGAKGQFSSAVPLPQQVDLTIERKGVAYLANLIWHRHDQAGFLFRTPTRLNETMSLDWALRLRASERVRKSLQQRIGELTLMR